MFRSQFMSLSVFMLVFLMIRIMLLGKVQIVLGDPSEIIQKNYEAVKVGVADGVGVGGGGDSQGEVKSQQKGVEETPNAPEASSQENEENDEENDEEEEGGKAFDSELQKLNEILGIKPGEGSKRGKGKESQHLPKDWRKYIRPNIDVIMNREEITKIDANGEIEYKANRYGQPIVELKVRTHGGYRRVRLEKAFLPYLPDTDFLGDNKNETRYKTCALVGNSGTNIGTGHGEDIDKHDAVIRINYATTKNFEYDVGSKTTFDIANKENCLKLAKGTHKWRRPSSTLIMWEAHSEVIRNHVYLKVLKSRGVEGRTLWLLSPSVVTISRMVWLTIKRDIELDIDKIRKYMAANLPFDRTLFTPFVVRKALKLGPWRANREMFQFHSKPMSGIVSLFFAIQVCDSVDMYGFDPFTLETRGKYHYFDDRAGMVNVHSFDMAMEIFRRISKAYPMRIHSRGSETKSFTP